LKIFSYFGVLALLDLRFFATFGFVFFFLEIGLFGHRFLDLVFFLLLTIDFWLFFDFGNISIPIASSNITISAFRLPFLLTFFSFFLISFLFSFFLFFSSTNLTFLSCFFLFLVFRLLFLRFDTFLGALFGTVLRALFDIVFGAFFGTLLTLS
jgi:hypothetical protein